MGERDPRKLSTKARKRVEQDRARPILGQHGRGPLGAESAHEPGNPSVGSSASALGSLGDESAELDVENDDVTASGDAAHPWEFAIAGILQPYRDATKEALLTTRGREHPMNRIARREEKPYLRFAVGWIGGADRYVRSSSASRCTWVIVMSASAL